MDGAATTGTGTGMGGHDVDTTLNDLRAIARVRQLDLGVATRELDGSRARVKELEETLARVRAFNTRLLADRGARADNFRRLHELEDQVDDWGRQNRVLKETLEKERHIARAAADTVRSELALARAELVAATTRADLLQAQLDDRAQPLLSCLNAASCRPCSSPDVAGTNAGPGTGTVPARGGFTVDGAAARRIVELVQELTGARVGGFGGGDLLQLGLSNAVVAHRDMDECLAHLRAAVETCYGSQQESVGWGALLAATFADVTFADDLLTKAWKDAVQCLHEAAEAKDAPPDATSFPISLKAGCLLSYVRTHLPSLAADGRAARDAGYRAPDDGHGEGAVVARGQ